LPTQVGADGGTSVAPVVFPTRSGGAPDPAAPHGDTTLPGLDPLSIGVPPTTAPVPASTHHGGNPVPNSGTSTGFIAFGAVGAALLLAVLFLVAGRFRRRVAHAVIDSIRGSKVGGREGEVPYELLRAWEQACATVGPLIGQRRSAETAHAYARRCEGRVPMETARQLDALATALGRAFFGPPPASALMK
jgi:hypothetical protein